MPCLGAPSRVTVYRVDKLPNTLESGALLKENDPHCCSTKAAKASSESDETKAGTAAGLMRWSAIELEPGKQVSNTKHVTTLLMR